MAKLQKALPWARRFDRANPDLEGGVREIVVDFLDELIKEDYPVDYFKPAASVYGKRGVADFICCIAGRYIAIETKAPNKGRKGQTPMQKRFEEKICKAGGTYLLIHNWKTFLDLIIIFHFDFGWRKIFETYE